MSSQGSEAYDAEAFYTLDELFPLGLQMTHVSTPVPQQPTTHRVYVSSLDQCTKVTGSGFTFFAPKRRSKAKPGANFIDEFNYRTMFDPMYAAIQSGSVVKLVIAGCAPGRIVDTREDLDSGVPKQLVLRPAGACPAVVRSVVNGESDDITDIVAVEGLILRCMACAHTFPERFGFFEIWLCIASRLASATALVDCGLHQAYIDMSQGLKAYMQEMSLHPHGESQASQEHRETARERLVCLWEEIGYSVNIARSQQFRCRVFMVELDLTGDESREEGGGLFVSEDEEGERPAKRTKTGHVKAAMIGSCLYEECYDVQLSGGLCKHVSDGGEVEEVVPKPREDYSDFWRGETAAGCETGAVVVVDVEEKRENIFDDGLDSPPPTTGKKPTENASEFWKRILKSR